MSVVVDPWSAWRAHTPARIALGRAGHALPTAEVLRIDLAHAQARDAVHAALDVPALSAALAGLGLATLAVASEAPDRATYLRRPDLGRRLGGDAAARLAAARPADAADAPDVLCVLADGLSALATQRHAVPLLQALLPRLHAAGLRTGPHVVIATQARVALGDAIGAAGAARAVLVLLGERPGLSSPDSLGAYLTWAPRPGRTDAERNCVSNIRPEGQAPADAARRLAWLCTAAARGGATGVALKDDSDTSLDGLPAGAAPNLPHEAP